jgi:hypothetical protein
MSRFTGYQEGVASCIGTLDATMSRSKLWQNPGGSMTKITRRKFVRTAGVGGVYAAAAAIAAPAVAQSSPESDGG